MIKNATVIRKRINSKYKRLEKQYHTRAPITYHNMDEHVRKTRNSYKFMQELEEIMPIFQSADNIMLAISEKEFYEYLSKADFAEVSFDGEWCKLAIVSNAMEGDVWLLFMLPVEAI